MGEAPLTVVEAPMGYGETTAARWRLRSHPGTVVWTSAFGSSPESFWRDFASELASRLPGSAKTARSLRGVGFPDDQVRAGAVIGILADSRASRLALVFDDCHLLPKVFADFCEALAVRGLPGLGVVCLTRDAWPGAGASLSLKDLLVRVDRDSLALDPSEIAGFFLSRGVGIIAAEAEELAEATGGWISALDLRLKARLRTGRTPSAADLYALVEREVYDVLSDEARGLLLALAPLRFFTGPQARYLYPGATDDLLRELVGKNSFIVFDYNTRQYYIHNIFREYILKRFNELTLEERRGILLACGRWHALKNQTLPALERLYQAADFDQALTILEDDLAKNLVTENAGFFAQMLDACPDELLRRHPGAAFKHALALFSAGDYPAFARRMAWLSDWCESAAGPGAWRGELELLRSLMAYNDIKAMSARHRRAWEIMGRPTALYDPESPWTLGCPSVLFMFHRQSGRLPEELLLMGESMPLHYKVTAHHGAGGEHLMEAEALFGAGRLAESRTSLAKGEALARRHRQTGNLICAHFLKLRLALLNPGPSPGGFDGGIDGGLGGGLGGGLEGGLEGGVDGGLEGALAAIGAMRGLIGRSEDYFYLHTVDLCEGWLHATLNRPERAPAWLRRGLDGGGRLYLFAQGFFHLVSGRIMLLEGRAAELLGHLDRLLGEGAFEKHLLFAIYANIYRAAALLALGRPDEALAPLREAASAAWPDGLIMPFVESRGLLGPLMERIDPPGLARVVELAERLERTRALAAPVSGPLSPYGLTARESEIPRLAADGLTHAEMAESLGVSPNTVKAHLKAGYRKRGVDNRRGLRRVLASPAPETGD